jgi:hypothetical protein
MNYCSSHLDKHQLDFDKTLSTFIFILASANEEVAATKAEKARYNHAE